MILCRMADALADIARCTKNNQTQNRTKFAIKKIEKQVWSGKDSGEHWYALIKKSPFIIKRSVALKTFPALSLTERIRLKFRQDLIGT